MELKYFAQDLAENLISYLETNLGLSYKNTRSSIHNVGLNGIEALWDTNYRAYYGGNIDDVWNAGGVRLEGEQGELVKMSVNQARALVGEFNSLVGKNRLAFEAIASQTSAKAFQSARLANSIAEQVVTEKNLDLMGDSLLENAGVLGAGFIEATWDPMLGRQISRSELGMKMSGYVRYYEHSVYDVFYDYSVQDFYELDWLVVCSTVNRWDLVASNPGLKKEILALPAVEPRFMFGDQRNQDQVRIMRFYHRKTPALPNGRLCIFSDPKTIYYDRDNPYGCIPVIQCRPNKIIGTGIGWPLFTELLPLQQMYDSSFSTIASNQSALGVQTILAPNNADLSVSEIGGLNFIRYNLQQAGGEPKALQLCNTPPEIFKFAELCLQNQMQISKINSALRGAPPPGVTSGAAIATLAANALELVQFASKSYTVGFEKLMDITFKIFKKFATEDQLTYMLGRNKQTMVKTWRGEDLESVHSVKMKTSNPLAKTAAGRITITEHMMQLGLIKTVDDYQMVQETGNLEQVTDDSVDESIWILEENDMLREGKPVQAFAAERHAMHIQKHKCLIYDPAIRANPELMAAVATHIGEHVELGKNTDPWLIAVVETGQMPPPQMMGPGGPMPGQPPGVPPGGPEGGPPPQVSTPEKAAPAGPAQPMIPQEGI